MICKCGARMVESFGNISALPGTTIMGMYRDCPRWKWWESLVAWGRHSRGQSWPSPKFDSNVLLEHYGP